MARTIQCISKINLSLFTSNVTRQLIVNGSRTVYTDESMGLIDYRKSRESFLAKYRYSIDSYRTKMSNIVSNEKEIVFTEDLKIMLHLVQKKPEEVELLQKILEKYNKQSNELRGIPFKFGPVVMRTFHYLNEPELAKELFLNPEYRNLFNQPTTFMILLHLLLENGQYKEIREIYDEIKSKFVDGPNYPKLAANVVGMACLKENTMESLEYGLKMCRDILSTGNNPIRRIIAILGALALQQNQPHMALELVNMCLTSNYISTKCIRIMAFADLDKLDDIVHDFQLSLDSNAGETNQYYCDVITKVEAAIQRLNIDESAEICDLLQKLKERGYIHRMTLVEHITQPIQMFKHMYPSRNFQSQEWPNKERGANSGSRFYGDGQSTQFNRQTNQYNSG